MINERIAASGHGHGGLKGTALKLTPSAVSTKIRCGQRGFLIRLAPRPYGLRIKE